MDLPEQLIIRYSTAYIYTSVKKVFYLSCKNAVEDENENEESEKPILNLTVSGDGGGGGSWKKRGFSSLSTV